MRRLTGPRSDESGAIVVLMAVATIVLVGMAALVVDVGSILDEKRQLQNGADAGALAVAHSCAAGACVHADNDVLAAGLASGNSRDGASDAVVSYPAATEVKVETTTREGGTNILPYRFAQALTGQSGTTVKAQATAKWGPVGTARALPLAVSDCDLAKFRLRMTESTFVFARNPDCEGSTDAPGAFGWLSNGCPGDVPPPPPITVGPGVPEDPGKSEPRKGCLDSSLNKDVLVPVYTAVAKASGKITYTIAGFAAIHLTGWRFPGDASPSPPCNPSASCISGTFVKFVTIAEAGGGTDFGVSRVFLVS